MPSRFSFEVVNAIDYDELRPGYAPEAIAWLLDRAGLAPGSTVIDLAAGTGQLSRAFRARSADLIAIEPARNMRAVLRARVPDVRVLGGTAESIPLEDRSVDAIVVGNAFHHFQRRAALEEIRRVLRPGGTLALFWAWSLEEEQRAIQGIGAIFQAVERARSNASIEAAYRSWSEPPPQANGFAPWERREFPMIHVLPSARLSDLYATSSDIVSMPIAERRHLLVEVARLSRALPTVLQLPARTVVDRCSSDASARARSPG